MTEGPLLRKILHFSLPLILANLLQTVYTLADLAIIGQFTDSAELAAVSVSGQITIFLTIVGNMLCNGGQVYVAQLVGQKRYKDISSCIGTLFVFILLCGLAMAVLGVAFARPMLRLLNTPAESFESAVRYLSVCSIGLIFLFAGNAICAALRGLGDAKAPTVFIAASSVLNIIGDLLLVKQWPMGAFGAALATAASQLFALILALAYLYRKREACHFDFVLSSFRLVPERLRVIISLALPLALQQIALHASMLYVSACINAYGVAAASLAGIGNKLYSVVSVVSGAMNTAMATASGQNLGAGKPARIKKALGICLLISVAVFLLLAFFSLVTPRAVFMLFSRDEAVLSLAPKYLSIAVWAYLFFALMHPVSGLVMGIGNTRLSALIGILDSLLGRVALSVWLGQAFGMWGYFWGHSLAGGVSALLLWGYYFSGRWKSYKALQ